MEALLALVDLAREDMQYKARGHRKVRMRYKTSGAGVVAGHRYTKSDGEEQPKGTMNLVVDLREQIEAMKRGPSHWLQISPD